MRFNSNNITTKSILNLKGFSLIELLIVLALITLVSLMIIPSTITQLRTASLNGKVSELSSMIYQYQQNAYYGLNNKSYGIRFNTNSYTLFIGNSFATAESSEIIQLEAGEAISSLNLANGGNDLIFSKGTLKPNTTGTINISNGSEIYQIGINYEGFIEYIKL